MILMDVKFSRHCYQRSKLLKRRGWTLVSGQAMAYSVEMWVKRSMLVQDRNVGKGKPCSGHELPVAPYFAHPTATPTLRALITPQ